jgi:transposase InsO family protein
MKRVVYC